MKNKKKPLIIALTCVAVLAAAAAGVWFFWLKDYLAASSAPPVYVNSVSSIVGMDTGANPRYSGIVEPQQTYKINKDESKTVAEVLVEPGDEVQAGDVLFRYDTQEMQTSLTQAEIDQQSIANIISTLQRQLTTAQTEKKNADKDEQAAYTIQIQDLEIQIKQQQYQASLKKDEIDKLRESMSNADVLSEVDGVVKEVNDSTNPQMDSSQSGFITILSSGEYRIRGSVSELNYASISVGQAVTVHSRLDAEQVWNGTVDSIDQEAAPNQNTAMYYGMDSGEKSSTYYFYVKLDSLEGLILGQHVYIEPDLGEAARKEGLWLPAMYVAHDDSGSFVWAKDDRDKLEKRMITLGEYDSENDLYEIKTGLARTDSIAYPSDSLMPGMPTTTDATLQDFSGSDTGSMEGPNGGSMVEPAFPVEDLEGAAGYDEGFDAQSSGASDEFFPEGSGVTDDSNSYSAASSGEEGASGGEGYAE